MRFSNAAGFRQAVHDAPWYSTARKDGHRTTDVETPSKNVWGNTDPGRREREKLRLAVDDPLMAMRQGAAGVREVEKQRAEWKLQRNVEIMDLKRDERRRERRRHRDTQDDHALEGFSLDHDSNLRRHSHHHRHHRRRREHDRPDKHHAQERDQHRPHTHRSDTHVPLAREEASWREDVCRVRASAVG